MNAFVAQRRQGTEWSDTKATKSKKWSKRLMNGRIAGERIFHGGKINVTPASREQSSRQQSRWCCCWFLLRTPQQWLAMLFIGADNPLNCHFPWGSGHHVIHGFLGPHESPIQTASRSVQPFSQGSRTWQTDRHTDRPRYSVCSNKPHLATAAMRSMKLWFYFIIRIVIDAIIISTQ